MFCGLINGKSIPHFKLRNKQLMAIEPMQEEEMKLDCGTVWFNFDTWH